jgi:hypothetical protein
MITRVLYGIDFDTNKKTAIAKFKMVDGKLVSVWVDGNDPMKKTIEMDGIIAYGKVFTSADGQNFFDALKKAFSRSTLVCVIDELDGKLD